MTIDGSTGQPLPSGIDSSGDGPSLTNARVATAQSNGECPGRSDQLSGTNPPGSRCSEASECAPHCCGCTGSRRSWLAAVCNNTVQAGQCLSQAEACAATRDDNQFCTDPAALQCTARSTSSCEVCAAQNCCKERTECDRNAGCVAYEQCVVPCRQLELNDERIEAATCRANCASRHASGAADALQLESCQDADCPDDC